jgi:hypothetical protein
MSALRLTYMFRMLKIVYANQAVMLNAESFKMKMIVLENKKEKNQFSMGTQSMSMMLQSQS